MSSENHLKQVEDLADRTGVIGALPSEQLTEVHVHATLALPAGLSNVAAELSMLREVIAETQTRHDSAFPQPAAAHKHAGGCFARARGSGS